MKYLVSLSEDKKLLLDEHQLAVFVTAVDGAEMLSDQHVGNSKGTHGYNNAYIHRIECKRTIDWLNVRPVADDFVDALKLAAKLENDK